MTREEYVHYSECRQASFTYRKGKRFREWANVSAFVEVKPNDDIVDSLGFLTYEMVSKLTAMALQIKRDLMEADGKKEEEGSAGTKRKREGEEESDQLKKEQKTDGSATAATLSTMDSTSSTTTAVTPGSAIAETETPHSSTAKDSPQEMKTKDDEEGSGLFSLPSTEQTPLQPEHIHEAFRRLQQSPQPIKNFRGGLVRTRISLI